LSSKAADIALLTVNISACKLRKSTRFKEACFEVQIALVPCFIVNKMMLTCNKVFWLP